MSSKKTIMVQANECFNGDEQKQEENELVQVIIQLITQLI